MVGKSPPFFRFEKDKSAVNIMRVLLVEDDPLIGNGLQIGLTNQAYCRLVYRWAKWIKRLNRRAL